MTWPFAKSRERLRREAADWLARLNAPDGESDMAEFERWYESDPSHAEAYDRLAARWEQAASLAPGPSDRVPAPRRAAGPPPVRYALAAMLIGAVAVLALLLATGLLPGAQETARYAAGDASQAIDLPDGSVMTLGAGSAAAILFDGETRHVSLERGRGRFSVARDRRAFIVKAGDVRVTARGTLFEVSLSPAGTVVALFEGVVDVASPGPGAASGGGKVTRLRPGQTVTVAGGPAVESSAPGGPAEGDSGRMLQFEDTPLDEVVAEANRHGRPGLRIAEPAIGRLRVTGGYRAGDPEGLARSLEAAFGLRVQRLPDGTLLLLARESESQAF